MAIALVLDEHLRGPIWLAFCQHNTIGVNPVDVTRVGDPPDLPRGTKDPELLLWAERNGRVIVSRDLSTMPSFLAAHLQLGRHSPGVLALRRGYTIPDLVDGLILAAYGYEPWELQDQVTFIP